MKSKQEPDSDEQMICLDETLSISTVSDFYVTLESTLRVKKSVTIDASGVASMDTSSLQTLLCFSQAIEKSGEKIEWLSPSDTFLKTAKLIGIEIQPVLSR